VRVGSLFSGIGGLDLGLERAGMEVRWQVEIEPYCNKVLAKHWPNVKRYGDIKSIDWTEVEPVDLICGGFPCQPVSLAGKRLAQEDERWLWPEVDRCLRALRPRYALLENVPVSFLPECQTYLETWPRAGMTRNGTAYQRPQLAPRTCVTGSGSSLIEMGMWPTPKSSVSGPDYARMNRPESGGDDLATAVARTMLPTPTVSCATGGQTSRGGKRKDEKLLAGIAGGQLNPTWVEWLMGFPLGWTDLEDSGTP
jgi:hypothetical protein